MPSKKQSLAVTAAAVGGIFAVGGATFAFADGSSATPTPSSTSSTPNGTGNGGGSGHQHGQPVSGTVAAAVTAAVKAKDPKVTVRTVVQDRKGGYEAFGTLPDGSHVRYQVSKDYRTVTLDHRRGEHGHHPWGKPVTGSALTSVKAKIAAKYPHVTIDEVRVDTHGIYHALGMRNGAPVEITASKDLTKFTEHALVPMHRGTPVTGAQMTKVAEAISAKYAGMTVHQVWLLPNGSYHASATGTGNTHASFTVSKDLKTITEHQGPAGGHHR